jgi:hypothetical protein
LFADFVGFVRLEQFGDAHGELRGVGRHYLLLDFEQLRRMHGKLAQAHAEQQRVSFGSPAISPHTATGMPTRCPLWMVIEISLSTAGCTGS